MYRQPSAIMVYSLVREPLPYWRLVAKAEMVQ